MITLRLLQKAAQALAWLSEEGQKRLQSDKPLTTKEWISFFAAIKLVLKAVGKGTTGGMDSAILRCVTDFPIGKMKREVRRFEEMTNLISQFGYHARAAILKDLFRQSLRLNMAHGNGMTYHTITPVISLMMQDYDFATEAIEVLVAKFTEIIGS